MKKLMLLLLPLFMVACGGDKKPVDPTPTSNKVIKTNITENTTWYADTVYQLGGRIAVVDGVTLTIEPVQSLKVKLEQVLMQLRY
jgi:hypothetical protein